MKVIGKVMLTPKGDYNATTDYEVLDLVRYDHKSWIALNAVTGVVPTISGTDWQLYTEDGRGIASVVDNQSGKDHVITITFDDNSNPFVFTIKDGNDGADGDMYQSIYDSNGDGIVNKSDEVGNAITSVLEKFNEDASGNPTYNGQVIGGGGSVDIDNITITKNSSNELQVADAITQKLSNIGEQILGTISGSTITFTDTKISGNYLLDVYCSDTDRYIDTQTISGNTMTVVCDDTISSGAIAVCVAIKKGV